ncbi:MAG: radical SAM protein [Kiritimatiellae bacterium]|nr:radical SAM protein [Kiritimatiellia bacterium]
MNGVYAKTKSLCPVCAGECEATYREEADGIFLHIECPAHGGTVEQAERDVGFFKKSYETDYSPPPPHLVLPVTYRCNLNCRYCYTLSNSGGPLPEDRSIDRLLEITREFPGNVTLIGGEPTVRHDLFDLIRAAKAQRPDQRLSLGTNGQRLRELSYVQALMSSGLDFVFLSVNDVAYEASPQVHENKVTALENCATLGIPVWLHRTVDAIDQLDTLPVLLETYRKTIFQVTVRAVKPFGTSYPASEVFVSDMAFHLGVEHDCRKGVNPFNRFVRLAGKKVKLSSWTNDLPRVEPLDSRYLISSDVMTSFHRGMRMDEVLLRRMVQGRGRRPPQPEFLPCSRSATGRPLNLPEDLLDSPQVPRLCPGRGDARALFP